MLATRAASAPVSRALEARVSERIADAWKVPAAALRLQWGRSSSGSSPAEHAPFRVMGRGEGGWFVVVFDPAETHATAIRVRAGVEQPVMVATRPLRGGSALETGDLREEVRVHWGAPALDSTLTPGPGWQVRRAIAAGEVVTAPAVAPPPMVVAGEPVQLEWRSGGVQVSVQGIALNSASRGQVVRARIEERPAQLSGTVTAPGRAVLAGGER
jgi:flagella basal body P-ring formation protein FlgA